MKIENGVLTDCELYYSETRAVIPEGVRVIDSFAFRRARSLREIIIPEGVKRIKDYAFGELEQLAEVYIPDSVTYLGGYAFEFCTGLRSVRLPEGLTVIEDSTFSMTKSLESITLPDSVVEVPASAFRGSMIENVRWRGLDMHHVFEPRNGYFDRFWFTREFTRKLSIGVIDRDEICEHYYLPFCIEYFARHRDDESAGAISAELDKAMELIFEADNVRALEALIEDGRFFTAGNIGGYIDAAAKTEKHEMYLMLVSHKESLGGSGEDRFGL